MVREINPPSESLILDKTLDKSTWRFSQSSSRIVPSFQEHTQDLVSEMPTFRFVAFLTSLLGMLLTLSAVSAKENPKAQWGQWRGPLSTGVAPLAKPPTRWSEKENIRGKAAIPGRGLSSPVVWGESVFLTTAIERGTPRALLKAPSAGAHNNMPARYEQKFVVLALNRKDGSVLWEHTARIAQPHEDTHTSGSWASQSPVTDGEVLCASFGSAGLYCYTLKGKLLWHKDLGDMEIYHGHGEGSSPALFKNLVIINWDHQGASFLVAMDKLTGKEIWRRERDEITSWASPLVVTHRGKTQVIISATDRIRGYELNSGEDIWACGGLSRNVVATPVYGDGFLYTGSSYNTRAFMGINLDKARGDITGTDAVAWTHTRNTPYVPSPILYKDSLCYIRHLQGVLSCVEPQTGKTQWGPQKLPGIRRVYASPVGAADKIYVLGRQGTTAVLKRSHRFQPLASNSLKDIFGASPAIVGNEIFMRGEESLYCIAE